MALLNAHPDTIHHPSFDPQHCPNQCTENYQKIILNCQHLKPNFSNKVRILNIEYNYANHHMSPGHVLLFTKSLGLNPDWSVFSSVCPHSEPNLLLLGCIVAGGPLTPPLQQIYAWMTTWVHFMCVWLMWNISVKTCYFIYCAPGLPNVATALAPFIADHSKLICVDYYDTAGWPEMNCGGTVLYKGSLPS